MGKTFKCLKNLVIPPSNSVPEPFSQSQILKLSAGLETKLTKVLSLAIMTCGISATKPMVLAVSDLTGGVYLEATSTVDQKIAKPTQ